MAISHSTALRAALAEKTRDFIDTGSGTAILRLFDHDGDTLIDFSLPNPSFASDGAGTITLNSVPITALGILAGDAETFAILNRNGDLAISGAVSGYGGPGDLQVTNVTITAGRRHAIIEFTYSAPL